MDVEERRDVLAAGADGEMTETVNVGWTAALEAQFGSAPWWLVSAVFHIIVILALGLVIASRRELVLTDEAPKLGVVTPIEPEPEQKPHEFFTQSAQRHDLDFDPEETVTFIHSDPDMTEEEIVTDNNVNDNGARGHMEFMSESPQMQTGVVPTLGINGGGSGAIGNPWERGSRKDRARRRIGPPGMSRKTIPTVNRALEWLARHQEPDGHWEGEKFGGKNTDAGITGLATLAFLGNGDTERHGKYKKNVFRAVTWLIRQQRGDGSIGHGYQGGLGYHHAIAGLALAEAYGMGKLKRTRAAAQKAINYSTAQHQSEYSGWRYKARTPADMSVTGWFVMQLKSAKMAELAVDGSGFQGAVAFLEKCTHSRGNYDGLVSYQPGRGPTPTMTAVGAVSRLFLGVERNDPLVTGAAHNLVENLPDWDGGNVNFYYWYYGTLAMFQVGGDGWKAWNPAMRDMLEERQRQGAPDVDGSWDPVGAWCGRGGRVYSTAMGALCLEVYWRYGLMHR